MLRRGRTRACLHDNIYIRDWIRLPLLMMRMACFDGRVFLEYNQTNLSRARSMNLRIQWNDSE